ncbi:hypothetical protein Tco_1466494, partial [Tanacetum coccineum]
MFFIRILHGGTLRMFPDSRYVDGYTGYVDQQVEHGSGEEVIEQGNCEEFVEHGSGQQVQYDVEGIDSAYDTQYYSDSSEDADGEDVDVVNVDGFDSETDCEDEVGYQRRKKLKKLGRDMKNNVLSDTAGINYLFYRGGPTGPSQSVNVSLSRSSGPTTRIKKRKIIGTANDSKGSSSAVDAHDKGVSVRGSCADSDERKATWISWKKVAASKLEGGLGVNNIFALNHALLYKLVWRFRMQPNALWSQVVGDGQGTRFWLDKWVGDQTLKDAYPRIFALELDKEIKVVAKLEQRDGLGSYLRLPRGGIEEVQMMEMRSAISLIILSPAPDTWVWTLDGSR